MWGVACLCSCVFFHFLMESYNKNKQPVTKNTANFRSRRLQKASKGQNAIQIKETTKGIKGAKRHKNAMPGPEHLNMHLSEHEAASPIFACSAAYKVWGQGGQALRFCGVPYVDYDRHNIFLFPFLHHTLVLHI